MLHSGNNFKLRSEWSLFLFIVMCYFCLLVRILFQFLIQLALALSLQFPAVVSATDWENVTSFLYIKHTKIYMFNLRGNLKHKEMPSLLSKLSSKHKKLSSECDYVLSSVSLASSSPVSPSMLIQGLFILQTQLRWDFHQGTLFNCCDSSSASFSELLIWVCQ